MSALVKGAFEFGHVLKLFTVDLVVGKHDIQLIDLELHSIINERTFVGKLQEVAQTNRNS
jgi:hypothetical protein